MLEVQEIVDRVINYHPNADVDLIRRAYDYAQWAHREQTRKSGEPYFIHPASVAGIIADLRLDTASVITGLLHDVVEDTDTSTEEISRDFGDEIAELVDGVTKLGKFNFTSKEDRQAENFRKMVMAMSKDIRVLLVKLCDRLDNMRTLEHMKPESQERIARETMEIYAPLASRLGMHNIKRELEDLAFKYSDPVSYHDLKSQLHKNRKEYDRYIEGVCRTIQSRLAEQGFAADVHGRSKHIYSIHRKLKTRDCDFEMLHDLLGFRICVESVADCYATLGVIHSKWMPIPGRFKDYIALPKPNMYQSLHTVVIGPGKRRIEVQIRTHEMHRVAEVGVAAHWQYKERLGGGVHPSDAARFSWLRELAEYQRNLKDPAEFLESVKIDLFPEEVYVFTPKGDVEVFPRGATPIDFAYAIHSEVGHHIAGARANGQIVPIRYKLRSGDVIEIMTSPNKQPTKDWLDACVTTRARTRIRNFLRTEQRARSLALGKELLETEMHNGGMSLTKLLKNETEMRRIIEHYHMGNREELLLSLGFGRVNAYDVVQYIKARQPGAEAPPKELKTSVVESLVRKVTRKDSAGIRVNGIEDVLIRYAKCCNPVTGDPIIGFITRGRGVTIHRRDCNKAFDTDPERRVDVSWDSRADVQRPVQLKVITLNSQGILATLSETFSAQKINLSEANCRATEEGRAHNVFTFPVGDLEQLKRVMKALQRVKGVVNVERV